MKLILVLSLVLSPSLFAAENASLIIGEALAKVGAQTDPSKPVISGADVTRGQFDAFFDQMPAADFKRLSEALKGAECPGCDWLEIHRMMAKEKKTVAAALEELAKSKESSPVTAATSGDDTPEKKKWLADYKAWLKDKLKNSPYGNFPAHKEIIPKDLEFIDTFTYKEAYLLQQAIKPKVAADKNYCVGCYLGKWGGFDLIRKERNKPKNQAGATTGKPASAHK